MTMAVEMDLCDFDFWGGAISNINKLTSDEVDTLDHLLEALNENSDSMLTPTEINDILWFHFEEVCDWLNLDYDKVMARG